MAVEDKQVYDSTSRKSESEKGGTIAKIVRQVVSVAAADDDTSIYRVAQLPASAVITNVRYLNTAMTSSSDWDLGIYLPDGGAVKDKDILDDGISFTVVALGTTPKQGLTAIGAANRGKKLWELAGDTDGSYPGAYDIALTANTVGTDAGSIFVELEYIIGV